MDSRMTASLLLAAFSALHSVFLQCIFVEPKGFNIVYFQLQEAAVLGLKGSDVKLELFETHVVVVFLL